MEKVRSLEKAVEKMDIASTEEQNKHEEEKKVEEENTQEEEEEERKGERPQNGQNRNNSSINSQISGKKIRKILKRLMRYSESGRGRREYRGRGDIHISRCNIYGGISN
ncbi:uncharacterized protein LOC143264000 [Megachile rotundata]|uniref:uncharacterized protein LOC143264000 n=1 Tax=Megachile rotundata TaxID=143995 RepID=UPI003FD075A2